MLSLTSKKSSFFISWPESEKYLKQRGHKLIDFSNVFGLIKITEQNLRHLIIFLGAFYEQNRHTDFLK